MFLDTLLVHPKGACSPQVRPAAEILLFYMTDVANLKLVLGATRGTIYKINLQQEMLIKEKDEKQVSSCLL